MGASFCFYHVLLFLGKSKFERENKLGVTTPECSDVAMGHCGETEYDFSDKIQI